MKYSHTIEINKPITEVLIAFQDVDSLPKWQEGLTSMKFLEGKPGERGSKMSLSYQMGKRNVDMIETIIENRLPDHFDALYEAKGVVNINRNKFEAPSAGTTRWTLHTEFKLGGFMKLLGLFFPGMFRKQTLKHMNDFKRFVEST